MLNKPIKLLFTITLILSLSGCLAVRKNKIPEIKAENLSINNHNKVKTFIDNWIYDSTASYNAPNLVNYHRKALINAINETNCCEIVKSQFQADLVIDGGFHNNTSQAGLAFAVITGLSLYTIPSWMNVESQVTAKVTRKGKSQYYDINDSLFFSQWLPFAIAVPFRGFGFKDEIQMNTNLYRNFVQSLEKDGFLRSR